MICTNKEVRVAPLLFFPLIENAFKYGTATDTRTRIEIILIQSNYNLGITITNSLCGQLRNNSTHLGITNVKRRLELLYPGNHVLELREKDGNFNAKLTLHVQ